MTPQQLISFARGAPSLDIVDVEGLKAAAVRAFEADPVLTEAYGTELATTIAEVRRGEIALFGGTSPEGITRAVRWKH